MEYCSVSIIPVSHARWVGANDCNQLGDLLINGGNISLRDPVQPRTIVLNVLQPVYVLCDNALTLVN